MKCYMKHSVRFTFYPVAFVFSLAKWSSSMLKVFFPLVYIFNFGCYSLGASNLRNFYTSGQKSRDSHGSLTCSFGEWLHLIEHPSGYQESTLKLGFVKLEVYNLMTNKIFVDTNYNLGNGHWNLKHFC